MMQAPNPFYDLMLSLRPLAYWTLRGVDVGTLRDVSGNNLHLAVGGSSVRPSRRGPTHDANSYAYHWPLDNATSSDSRLLFFDGSQPFTACFWFKYDTNFSEMHSFPRHLNADGVWSFISNAVDAIVDESNLNMSFTMGDFYLGARIRPDQWYLAAGTYDGSIGRLYLNGIQRDYGINNQHDKISTLFNINSYGGYGWTGFHGDMSDIAIFDRCLTASEILNLYIAATQPVRRRSLAAVNPARSWPLLAGRAV